MKDTVSFLEPVAGTVYACEKYLLYGLNLCPSTHVTSKGSEFPESAESSGSACNSGPVPRWCQLNHRIPSLFGRLFVIELNAEPAVSAFLDDILGHARSARHQAALFQKRNFSQEPARRDFLCVAAVWLDSPNATIEDQGQQQQPAFFFFFFFFFLIEGKSIIRNQVLRTCCLSKGEVFQIDHAVLGFLCPVGPADPELERGGLVGHRYRQVHRVSWTRLLESRTPF